MSSLTAALQAAAGRAETRGVARFGLGERALRSIIELYKPGSEYEKLSLASYGRSKKRALGPMMQGLASRGLYGTTARAGLSNLYESTVGTEYRLGKIGGLAGAYGGLGGYYGQGATSQMGAWQNLMGQYASADIARRARGRALHGEDWGRIAAAAGAGYLSGGWKGAAVGGAGAYAR